MWLIKLLTRIFVAAVFIWAAFAKFRLPAGGPTLYEHWLFAWPPLRYLVPGAELLLGAWLLTGWRPRGSTTVTIALTSAFSGLLISEMFKSHPEPCGCMGTLAVAYDPGSIRFSLGLGLARNAIIIAGAAFIFLSQGRTAPGSVQKLVPENFSESA